MKLVKELLEDKGHEVWTITPQATVYQALELIAEKDIGALLAMDDGRVAGVFTERDYARKVILAGRASRQTSVRDVMTTRVISVRPDQSVENCMALMTEKRIRHLPVMEGDDLKGLVSIGDLVKAIIAEQRYMIDQLEHYISG